jgi:hypothetical protein
MNLITLAILGREYSSGMIAGVIKIRMEITVIIPGVQCMRIEVGNS